MESFDWAFAVVFADRCFTSSTDCAFCTICTIGPKSKNRTLPQDNVHPETGDMIWVAEIPIADLSSSPAFPNSAARTRCAYDL